jgi:hypothetical protein
MKRKVYIHELFILILDSMDKKEKVIEVVSSLAYEQTGTVLNPTEGEKRYKTGQDT